MNEAERRKRNETERNETERKEATDGAIYLPRCQSVSQSVSEPTVSQCIRPSRPQSAAAVCAGTKLTTVCVVACCLFVCWWNSRVHGCVIRCTVVLVIGWRIALLEGHKYGAKVGERQYTVP